jgi:hypothetical protein
MALLLVMTVCVRVYAALEYRIRQALPAHEATFPNQQDNGYTPPRRTGYSMLWWDSLDCACLGRGPGGATSPTSTNTCFSSLENHKSSSIAEYACK